jgi:hypothetical protein
MRRLVVRRGGDGNGLLEAAWVVVQIVSEGGVVEAGVEVGLARLIRGGGGETGAEGEFVAATREHDVVDELVLLGGVAVRAGAVTAQDAEAVNEEFGCSGERGALAMIVGVSEDGLIEGSGVEDGSEAEAGGDALASEVGSVDGNGERAG